jgi:hypothetical protein
MIFEGVGGGVLEIEAPMGVGVGQAELFLSLAEIEQSSTGVGFRSPPRSRPRGSRAAKAARAPR